MAAGLICFLWFAHQYGRPWWLEDFFSQSGAPWQLVGWSCVFLFISLFSLSFSSCVWKIPILSWLFRQTPNSVWQVELINVTAYQGKCCKHSVSLFQQFKHCNSSAYLSWPVCVCVGLHLKWENALGFYGTCSALSYKPHTQASIGRGGADSSYMT